ncbi:MAG: CotH kinase family protein [Clostridia bacterium]|nr:CotH kinase family protein [Clostridia bacterium]
MPDSRIDRKAAFPALIAVLAAVCCVFSACRGTDENPGAQSALPPADTAENAQASAAPDADGGTERDSSDDGRVSFGDSTAIFKTRTERNKKSSEDLGLCLAYRGVELPKAGNTYSLPIGDGFTPEDLLELSPGGEELRMMLDGHIRKSGIDALLRHGTAEELLVYTDTEYVTLELVFTTLPVLSADIKRGSISGADKKCSFSLWEARGRDLKRVDSPATIKVRGASSASLAKSGLKISLKDGAGEPNKVSLLGMRKDDDWILYASYSDYAHVRDEVGWRLWRRMTEALGLTPSGALETRYVELILGGTYDGFYLFMERMDEKKLSLDAERGDSLFKCVSWDIPESARLRSQAPRSASYSSIEKKFPDPADRIDGSWENIADFVALAYEASGEEFAAKIEEVADRKNMLAYWLFLNLSMAADNTWKNTYYATIDGKMYAFPWDLDITFGLGWNGDLANNYLWEQPGMAERTYDFQAGRRMLKYIGSCLGEVREMYYSLKDAGIAGADAMIADAEEIWDLLHNSGAWARNLARWPNGNNTDSLDYFKETVVTRERWLEDYLG